MDTNLIIAAIDAEIGNLQQARVLLSSLNTAPLTEKSVVPSVRRKRSQGGRKLLAEAQKKPWEAVKSTTATSMPAEKVEKSAPARKAAAKKSPKQRSMSPAARKRIAEAQMKRWAAARAAKEAPKPAVKKAAKKAAKKAPLKLAKKATKHVPAKKAPAIKPKKATAPVNGQQGQAPAPSMP